MIIIYVNNTFISFSIQSMQLKLVLSTINWHSVGNEDMRGSVQTYYLVKEIQNILDFSIIICSFEESLNNFKCCSKLYPYFFLCWVRDPPSESFFFSANVSGTEVWPNCLQLQKYTLTLNLLILCIIKWVKIKRHTTKKSFKISLIQILDKF